MGSNGPQIIAKRGTWALGFRTPLFTDPSRRVFDEAALVVLLQALAEVDRLELIANPRIPRLYRSLVRWRDADGEFNGKAEEFTTIEPLLARGHGDCKDLSAWRVAELRYHDGEVAGFVLTPFEHKKGRTYHIRVRRADGSIEDPSQLLGMKVPQWFQPHF